MSKEFNEWYIDYIDDDNKSVRSAAESAWAFLQSRIAELEQDNQEQCRLNAMGAEREARLMARVAELEGLLAAAQQGVQPVATRYRFIINGVPRKWEVGGVEIMGNHDFVAAQKRGEFEMHPLYTRSTTQGLDAPAHPAEGVPAQTDRATELAPPNSLPTFDECALRVENSNFLEKRAAGGGYGPEHDSKTATQLHRFIYEYDDADPVRSSWFLHRLELLLNEVRSATQPAAQGMDADTLLRVIQRLNQNPYSLTKCKCIAEVQNMREEALAAQAKQGGQP